MDELCFYLWNCWFSIVNLFDLVESWSSAISFWFELCFYCRILEVWSIKGVHFQREFSVEFCFWLWDWTIWVLFVCVCVSVFCFSCWILDVDYSQFWGWILSELCLWWLSWWVSNCSFVFNWMQLWEWLICDFYLF